MKKISTVALVIALVAIGLALICRIKLAPIAGLTAQHYLAGAQTALLLTIALLLMEKK
jgi:hypothetical protein